jgi:hypothetical protein
MVCCCRISYAQIILFFLLSLVNLDDCWQVSRDAEGTIQVDPVTFPSGIPALADYVHSKKLKFGLYSGTEQTIFIYSLIKCYFFLSLY